MQEANKISRQKIDEKRRKALISETIEFETLQEMNIAIDAQNAKLSKEIRKDRKQHLIFERMFKYDDIEQRKKKNEIDAYFYKNNILLSLLYSFYEKTQRKHFDKQI